MICPHCKTGVSVTFRNQIFWSRQVQGGVLAWQTKSGDCPECRNAIIYLEFGAQTTAVQQPIISQVHESRLINPLSSQRPCPPEVPSDITKDFTEAALVLPLSAQASAALSRRCLQHLLKKYGGAKKKDLADQIQEVIVSNQLPSSLSSQLDAIRNIGNFAAHPQKSTSSGEILSVEPQEAEWNLDVLEELFDHFFVKPAKAEQRKIELNKKLAAVGKPPIV